MLIEKKLWIVIFVEKLRIKPFYWLFQTEKDALKCKLMIANLKWSEVSPALPKPVNVKEMEELYWEKVGNVRGEFIWIEEV